MCAVSEYAKTFSEIATAMAVVFGAGWTAYVFGYQRTKDRDSERSLARKEADLRAERQQHEREALAWRRTRQAKELNDEMMNDDEAAAALDWIDDDFAELTYRGKTYRNITAEAVFAALGGSADEAAYALRRSLDAWFYYLVLFQHYISRQLIVLADIEYPVSYYVRALRANEAIFKACVDYIESYKIDARALTLMEVLSQGSQGVPPRGRPPPDGPAGSRERGIPA